MTAAAKTFTQHTQTPWYLNGESGPTQIAAVEPFADVGVCFTDGRDNGRANAEFVVHAVNAHYGLVKALESLVGDDCSYVENEIRIRCASHGDAIKRMSEARAALEAAKAAPPAA